jgi:hypothetical protein
MELFCSGFRLKGSLVARKGPCGWVFAGFRQAPGSGQTFIDTVQFGFAVDDPTTDISQNPAINIGIWPVPEPGTLALLGFGLAGFAWARRRRAN